MVKGLCLSRMVKGKRALTKTHGFTQKSRAHKQKRRKKRDHRCRATKAKLTYKKRHSSKPLFFFESYYFYRNKETKRKKDVSNFDI